MASSISVRLYLAAAGNEFMLDIARAFAEGFAANDVPCDILLDQVPTGASATHASLVVAPHEFVPLCLDRLLKPAAVNAVLGQVYILNTEQPGSQWFELTWRYAQKARGVFDISQQGVHEFRRRGIAARLAPLGYASTMEALRRPDQDSREIDVLFLGHHSKRREEFLARHAAFFAARNCRLLLSRLALPRRTDTPGYQAGNARLSLLATSRILLNIHSSQSSYFEWHRALLALSNRCLLISEVSSHTAPLVSGEHFLMGPLEELPGLCRQYLDDPPACRSITERGYAFAREQLAVARSCRSIVEQIQTVERSTSRWGGQSTGGSNGATGSRGEETEERARRQLVERLAVSRDWRTRGNRDWDAEPNDAYRRSTSSALSVIITLHNYEQFIEECIASVRNSEALPEGQVEAVIVDDASIDGSVARVERLMRSIDLPILFVRKRTNTGPADARNVGMRCARATYMFVLDADNWVYPSCLRTLHSAIISGAYSGVFGLIRRFDDETGESIGLLSMYDWDVKELLRRPYIDAMAMFDRQKVMAVGGYATELIEHGWFGWEDYDLWLQLAQAGHACARVPRLVGSYRVHGGSMLHRTNRSSEAIARYFHKKFERLVNRYPALDSYFGFPARTPGGAPGGTANLVDNDVDPLSAQRIELERRLAEVYASSSWRITAPLRFVYRCVTGRP